MINYDINLTILTVILRNTLRIVFQEKSCMLRFDCQASNIKLNEYYERLGFGYVGIIKDGLYVGNKHEKII